jgi:hypothetical protein
MASVLVPGNDGRPTRVANINGTNVRCLVIRGDVWFKDDDPNDAPPPQLDEAF